jgi:Asp-tRNA(Asn)/Glu-tRNA(Gln) amidotransferase B subunit
MQISNNVVTQVPDSNLRHAVKPHEEAWIIAAAKLFEQNPEWYLLSLDRLVGEVMKLSGGSLNPNIVRQKLESLKKNTGVK